MSNQAKYEEILNSTANRIVIVAGPGTGKTSRVMIPKASQVFSDGTIDSNSVVLSSFSRMAALDLKKKVRQLDRAPYACTVHSLCLSFLISENDHAIRNRIDSVVLDFEKETLISDLKQIFPQQNKKNLKKDLALFSAAWSKDPNEEIFEENDQQKAFKRAIMSWLSEYEAVLMEEIAHNAVKLGRSLNGASFLQNIKYLFVDEFQDLNKLEQEFVKIASTDIELLIVLGDPDQSIYSFKFAHPQGIDSFANNLDNVERHTLTYTGRCAKRIIEYANQLLLQNDPTRTDLLQPLPDKEEGEVHFVRRNTQDEEFDNVITRIKELVDGGVGPEDILVLSPKRKLGDLFVKYAKDNQDDEGVKFAFLQKNEFTHLQQERITLLGVLANPNSLLRIRTYIGLIDDNHFSGELKILKEKYGNLHDILQNAKEEDFTARQKRLRRLCTRINDLRDFLSTHTDQDLTSSIEELFPENVEELKELRTLINDVYEEEDSIASLYTKFSDQMRTLNTPDNVISVMTPLASKGLEADHVFIIGCNDGNIPGKKRAEHLTEHEHIQEQRRLLYVAFTRAKKTLTISWSRFTPFDQALGQNTGRVATRRINGKVVAQVGICQFLQDLENINWE